MQMKELQSMTVVQLRALARENKVKLSAGIDKEGIVQRLYHALGDSDESTAATQEEAAPVSAEGTVSDESSAVPQENRLEESLAADVTSVQPGSGYRPWGSERTEETNGSYHPFFRQGWQARTAPQRETSPRPTWQQQQQRPVGTANRFGPQGEAWDINEDGTVVELIPDSLTDDFTIENYKYTYGMTGLGTYITKEENAEVLEENSFTSWYRIDCVKQLHEYCVPVENQLPIRFVDPEKTSERTFMETELFSYISNFIATSVLDGIDDAKWEEHLSQLDAVQYNEWLNWYQEYLDKEF